MGEAKLGLVVGVNLPPYTLAECEGDESPLIPGAFYWALPVLDVDYDDVDEAWWNEPQPARFGGLDDTGNEVWYWLKTEAIWPKRWVGKRIVP